MRFGFYGRGGIIIISMRLLNSIQSLGGVTLVSLEGVTLVFVALSSLWLVLMGSFWYS